MGPRKTAGVDMSSEAGRLLFFDYINYKTSGFSPFNEEDIGSKEHWNSREEFQQVGHASFILQAQKMAAVARASFPQSARPDTTTGTTRKAKTTKSPLKAILPEFYTPSEEAGVNETSFEDVEDMFDNLSLGKGHEGGAKSLRDPLNLPYPTNDRIFLLFELDGSVQDGYSNQFEITDEGHTVNRWVRVPSARIDANRLIGVDSKPTSSFAAFMDSDAMLIQSEIQKRKAAMQYKTDENGDIWELKDSETLAFPCKEVFYDKTGHQIGSYIFEDDGDGYY